MDILTTFLNNIYEKQSDIDICLERVECMINDLENEFFIYDNPNDKDLQMITIGYDDARVRCDIAAVLLHDAQTKLEALLEYMRHSIKELTKEQEDQE